MSITAAKAELEFCCTSGNALNIVESLGVGTVIMLLTDLVMLLGTR